MTWRWFLMVLLASLAGYLLVQYMVQPPAQMGLYAVLLAAALAGLVFVLFRYYKGREWIPALLVAFLALIGGYLLSNAVFLSQEEVRQFPGLTRSDGGDGHTAVIYFTHGEPPGYSALPWIETIREFDRDKAAFVPWPFRPFFFNQLRAEYLQAGGSAHNKLHRSFFDNLRRSMPEAEKDGTRFYLAFLDNDPRPDEVAIQAINEGASRIVVLPVFVTESTHTLAGQEMVNSVLPQDQAIQVCYTGALWNSEALQRVFVERAREMTGPMDKSRVGILLLGHGQPAAWEDLYPAQNEQETKYRQAIQEKLVQAGYSADHIALGWMEFQEPTITETVSDLAKRGVDKILVFSVSLSADSIHSDIEVPAAVEQARLSESIQVEYVGQYSDHPLAIQAMREKILVCYENFRNTD